MMLSLETARALKEAGLKWEPKILDWFTFCAENIEEIEPHVLCVMKTEEAAEMARKLLMDKADPADVVWLPSLDQLLDEFRHRGVMYVLNWKGGKHHLKISDGVHFVGDYENEIAEECCAQALLWILEQERGE